LAVEFSIDDMLTENCFKNPLQRTAKKALGIDHSFVYSGSKLLWLHWLLRADGLTVGYSSIGLRIMTWSCQSWAWCEAQIRFLVCSQGRRTL